MNTKNGRPPFILSFIFIIFLMTACDPVPTGPTPTPNLPYYPGCSADNLIGHIGQANGQPGPDVIHLDPGCVYTLEVINNTTSADAKTVYSGLPIIISPITIYGNNAVIDIQPAENVTVFGHFFIDPIGDLELYDLTLENGSRPLGGSVINLGGDFFASNVTFTNNLAFPSGPDANARGGAIYNNSGRVRVINSCHFEQNKAGHLNNPGDDQGGAIYSENGTLVVSSSTFQGNNANGEGGAIYSRKNQADESGGLVRITNSEFGGNYALQNGGAIALVNEMNGPTFITDSDFSTNHVDGSGGAIYSEASDLKVDFDRFENNTAAFGGAIYSKRIIDGSPSILSSEESFFNENVATDIGGAIFSQDSDLVIHESRFQLNRAESCGAIRNGGSPDYSWGTSTISAARRIDSNAEITMSYFNNNYAIPSDGGAICHMMGDLTIRGGLFSANVARGYGGALILMDNNELSGLRIMSNSAQHGGGAAIGFTMEDSDEAPTFMDFQTEISFSEFKSNNAEGNGGGFWSHHAGRALITHSLFSRNDSSYDGGGVFLKGGDHYFNNSTFYGNVAASGGGLFNTGYASNTLGIKHSTFAMNYALETPDIGIVAGGGLNISGNVQLENSLITKNMNGDCDLNQGMTYTRSGNVDSDDTCGVSMTEAFPKIATLAWNGGDTRTIALLSGSPLIDILPNCAGLADDQRGVLRPQGAKCDPGAYEFDDWQTISLESDDSSDNCDPFANAEVSLVMLNVAAGSTDLTLYLKVTGGVQAVLPAIQDEDVQKIITAMMGTTEANLCNLQGFDDRIYCMFTLPPEMLGTTQDLMFLKPGCEDPVLLLPGVSIPTPSLVCKESLAKDDCEEAGGHMSSGVAAAPICVCP